MIRLKDLLKEIGDSSSQPYRFDYYSNYAGMRVYGFDTPNYAYTVELQYEFLDGSQNVLGVRFYVSDEEDPDIERDDIVTNKGELFKVMATVVAIIKKDIQTHPEVDTLRFIPSKKEGESSNVSRTNLYMRYIKHEFPDAIVTHGPGDSILVKIKDNIESDVKYDASGIDTPNDPTM
jgi:hypothetical protein